MMSKIIYIIKICKYGNICIKNYHIQVSSKKDIVPSFSDSFQKFAAIFYTGIKDSELNLSKL